MKKKNNIMGNIPYFEPIFLQGNIENFLDVILTGTPLATISGIFSAQMVSSPALSADPKDDVEEW